MKTRKDRRSRRIPASYRLMFTVFGPDGSEVVREIVSTVELSQFGARVRGRQVAPPESRGILTQLSSGRRAHVRVAWQDEAVGAPGFVDTGIEVISGPDYWGISFAEPEPVPVEAATPPTPMTAQGLLDELNGKAARDGALGVLETIWCGLVEQLEARKVITREELIAAVRSVAATKSHADPAAAAKN
jgi:hypothetical protein